MVDDREEPRPDLAARRIEARGLFPEREERVLHHVLSRGGIGSDAVREPVGDAAVAVVQGGDGILVAVLDGPQEGRVVYVPAAISQTVAVQISLSGWRVGVWRQFSGGTWIRRRRKNEDRKFG
jgi:hypothetical protein